MLRLAQLEAASYRAARSLLQVAAATLCAYLTWLAADVVVFQAPRLLLAAFSDLEVLGFRASHISAGWSVSTPPEGSAGLDLINEIILPLSSVLLAGLSVFWIRRLNGWLLLFWFEVLFFAGLRSALAVFSWSATGQGALISLLADQNSTLAQAARVFVPVAASSPLWIILHLLLRRFVDSAGGRRAARLRYFWRWGILPLAILGSASALPSYEFPRSLALLSIPVAVGALLLVGLPAVICRPDALTAAVPGARGAFIVSIVAAVTLGGLTGQAHLQARGQHREEAGQMVAVRSGNLRLHIERGLLKTRSAEEWAREQEQQLASSARRLHLAVPNPGLEIYLYGSSDLRRSLTRNSGLSTRGEGSAAAHCLVTDPGRMSGPRHVALLLMRHAWGRPANDRVAQALAAYAAGRYFDQELEEFARRITAEEGCYPLRAILGLDPRFVSPLVSDVLAGAWIERLAGREGPSVLKRLYRTPLENDSVEAFAHELGKTWQGLEDDWKLFLIDGSPPPCSTASAVPGIPAFFKGMTLTQQGRRFGYGSEQALRQLDRFRELGVDAVAVVPYGRTGAPMEPTVSAPPEASEEDLLSQIRSVHERGLRCILKPHLVTRQGFPGSIRFESRDRFLAWFPEYRKWILHYARLAQVWRADAFVIGTELSGISQYSGEWRSLIKDVRCVYGGPITYAANWGRDFDETQFWDSLDFIGLNMYYPLAAGSEQPDSASSAVTTLKKGLAAMAARFNKRIVFMEVGYPNTKSAAAQPWQKGDGFVSNAMQAACYRTVFEAFYREPWFGGMFWWEWPTHGYGPRYYHTYNPIDKPALAVIEEWYRGKGRSAP